jgi:glycine/D-amino acid oxidase-like deaminating enzyme
VAAKPSHFPRLRAEHDALGRLPGMGAELLTPDEARRELGSSHYHGALLDPAGGSLQPATYLAGLADAARRAGASLCERTEARRLTRAPGGFSIDTSRGAIHARDVLIATNGYTGALTPALRRRVVPIGSHIIATEPLTADLARELIPQRRVVSDTRNLLFYFRLSTDNRMVFGGRASFTPTSLARTSAILRRGMVTVFPQLAGVQVTHGWGGNVCFTLDELPHAGRLDGIHYALGYCGHGVAMATYLGAWMGEAIAGRRALPPFASHRFPAIPFYEGVPWFLPLAGAWFRALDFL